MFVDKIVQFDYFFCWKVRDRFREVSTESADISLEFIKLIGV